MNGLNDARPSPEVDFFLTDSLLTDEERAIRDRVRAFAEDQLRPVARQAWEHADFPDIAPTRARRAGRRRGHGAGVRLSGMTSVAFGLALRELARVDSSFATFFAVHGGSACRSRSPTCGSEEQKARWLPRLARVRGDRRIRPDRAGARQRRLALDDARDPRRRRLRPRRRQALDRQRDDLRRRHRLGARRGWHRRVPGRTAHSRLHRDGDRGQAVAAGTSAGRHPARRLPRSGREPAAAGRVSAPWPRCSAWLAALRRLARAGGGDRLLRDRPRLRAAPRAVRQADRRVSSSSRPSWCGCWARSPRPSSSPSSSGGCWSGARPRRG